MQEIISRDQINDHGDHRDDHGLPTMKRGGKEMLMMSI